jgi:organic radical activating enzyme
VIEIFDSLQGEGYWTGTPMTFVRLAGCNAPELGLDCVRWCDTPGSWEREAGECLAPSAILERAHFSRICLTGGEPLLQAEGAADLVAEAHRLGMRVHLETNGTVAPPGTPDDEDLFDWVVASPKPLDYFIAAEWDGLIDELKLVVDEGMDAATAERLAAAHPEAIVSIQPVWEAPSAGGTVGAAEGAAPGAEGRRPAGETSESRAISLVMTHPDWRLSLQTHKYLDIR